MAEGSQNTSGCIILATLSTKCQGNDILAKYQSFVIPVDRFPLHRKFHQNSVAHPQPAQSEPESSQIIYYN